MNASRWNLSIWASMSGWRKARLRVARAHWTLALGVGLPAAAVAIVAFTTLPADSLLAQAQPAPHFTPTEPANSPMGTAFGIKPGRVAWTFDPKATTWDGTNNAPGWWDDRYTHPEVVEKMLADVVCSVGDAPTVKEAWSKIFSDFNTRKGRGTAAYKKGEKIAIKLNLNQTLPSRHGDGGYASYTAPQLVQALLRQLVRTVGVAPTDITCYDAIRYVPSTIFDRCTKEFPGVHFVDWAGGDGREQYRRDTNAMIHWAQPLGGTPVYLPTCATEATYLVNVAGLKGHGMAGITVCGKNHLGSMLADDEDGNPSYNSPATSGLHTFITVKPGRGGPGRPMGSYNPLVDLDGHKDLGGKTVLCLIDGLYATRHNEYRLGPTCRWESAPFNGHWTSSLFASQNGVAIDSVALDFLRSEPSLDTIVTGTVDNYLHEAAQANQPPSKTIYDPEHDGSPLANQGVHEHWNNAQDKQYTRNLGKGNGIELVSLKPAS